MDVKVGDIFRVTYMYVLDAQQFAATANKVPFLAVAYSDEADFNQQQDELDVTFVFLDGTPAEQEWTLLPGDRYEPLSVDDLTDEECAALMKWKLSGEAG